MAAEKRRQAGELAAWHAATILGPFTGQEISPADINPYRVQAPPTEAQRRLAKWQRRRRWRAALRGLSKGKWKG